MFTKKIQSWFQNWGARTKFRLRLIIFIIAILVAGLTLHAINVNYLAENPETGQDFLVHWLSTKLFLARGLDPYSVEMRQIVTAYSGEILSWTTTIPETSVFSMPIYGFLIYLPFIFFDSYLAAYAWWLTLMEVCIFISGIVSFRLVLKNFQKYLFPFSLILLLFCGNPFSLIILSNGFALPITVLMLLLSVAALKKGADELAGVLLAFSSFQIRVVWLPILFILIWSLRQHRGKLVGWFAGTIAMLGIASALIQPEWPLFFGRGIFRILQETQITMFPQIMAAYYPGTFGRLGQVIIIVTAILLGIEWILSRRHQFAPFFWTLTLSMAASVLFSPQFQPAFVYMGLPGMALVFLIWIDRWGRKGAYVAFLLWFVYLGYAWMIYIIEPGFLSNQLDFWYLLPPVTFYFAALYWIRWWLYRNTDLWFEEVYRFEHPDRRKFWDAD
ncbi:MAG: hypothetical protein HPY85_04760 [Anaerolineae bacterium]|nr:hypothetical protein [Anaerolineae bacterium]